MRPPARPRRAIVESRPSRHSTKLHFGELTLIHLRIGDCLLPSGDGRGCECGLRDKAGDESPELWVAAYEALHDQLPADITWADLERLMLMQAQREWPK